MSKRSEAQATVQTIYPSLVDHLIKVAMKPLTGEGDDDRTEWNDCDEAYGFGLEDGKIQMTRDMLDRFGIPDWRK